MITAQNAFAGNVVMAGILVLALAGWYALGEWITARVSKHCARRRMAHRAALRAAVRPTSPRPDGRVQWTDLDDYRLRRARARGVEPARRAA